MQKYCPHAIDSDRPMSKRETAKDNAIFALGPPGANISLAGHDFFVRRWLYTGVQATRGIKRALPVVECIDCVSDVGEDVLATLVHGHA
ncbi:hypothetical protein FRC0024_02099 [Corynebacterium diphtheriae]|nr:hypothetical protein FRC0024_02099 [Corynebacterium diphtheriae]